MERKLAAILAADLVGFSRMMGRDEEGTLARLKQVRREVLEPALGKFGGRIFKTTGDGFLIEFGSVIDAYRVAAQFQQELHAANKTGSNTEPMVFRIGINVGDVICDDGDVYGDGVNIAARLEPICPPGGICVSERAWRDLRQLDIAFVDIGDQRMKNIGEAVRAFAVMPSGEIADAAGRRRPYEATVAKGGDRRKFLGIGLLAIAAIAAVILGGAYLWGPWDRQSPAPIVAVSSAEPTANARNLARDLLVKLGSLQSARSDTIQLAQIESTAGRKADLIFEVGAKGDGGEPEANLSLLSGTNRGLLWSRNFKQPAGRQSDLEQQLAYTAARVLECAAEALEVDGKPLAQLTLKLYLTGCADLSVQAGTDTRDLIPLFKRVTEQAPALEGAWAMLVMTQSDLATNNETGTPATRATLKKYVADARKHFPEMSEAYLVEAFQLPTGAIFQRLQMFDEALARNPDDARALISRAFELLSVGRMKEAVADTRRAVRIDPLSPAKRDALIGALTYSGQLEAATKELQHAEKLWPEASNLLVARYRLHLRYGDPREAMRIFQSGELNVLTQVDHEVFLKARLDPIPANIDRAVKEAESNVRRYPEAIANYAQTMGTFDRNEELIATLLAWRQMDDSQGLKEVLFRPALRNLHHDPRFMRVAAKFGLVGYWRKSGKWPDFCFDPNLRYDCKAEAANLQ